MRPIRTLFLAKSFTTSFVSTNTNNTNASCDELFVLTNTNNVNASSIRSRDLYFMILLNFCRIKFNYLELLRKPQESSAAEIGEWISGTHSTRAIIDMNGTKFRTRRGRLNLRRLKKLYGAPLSPSVRSACHNCTDSHLAAIPWHNFFHRRIYATANALMDPSIGAIIKF